MKQRGTDSEPIFTMRVASPIGELVVRSGAKGITAILFPAGDIDRWGRTDPRHTAKVEETKATEPVAGSAPIASPLEAARANAALAARQLDEYFEKKRDRFDLPIEPGGTEFESRVWRALLAIPCGETLTYSQVAAAVGSPEAVRAVGAAVGKNPIAIVIPCHRVVGANGSLTGFGGGLGRKAWLLDHESGQRRLSDRVRP